MATRPTSHWCKHSLVPRLTGGKVGLGTRLEQTPDLITYNRETKLAFLNQFHLKQVSNSNRLLTEHYTIIIILHSMCYCSFFKETYITTMFMMKRTQTTSHSSAARSPSRYIFEYCSIPNVVKILKMLKKPLNKPLKIII